MFSFHPYSSLYKKAFSLNLHFPLIFFSFLKRKAKVKDTGNFFPGHGGVLDRLDGIFLGVPTGYLSLILLY